MGTWRTGALERGKMKLSRQSKIIELIAEHEVETQEELAELLLAAGYPVTQATISRDILS